ncbi:ABC transporter permease [Plantactinospora sp. B6F1]|uniref:ABC transporter permease n=1 Tax=Plantactinospora sp. B6F1 TaxID=3158971 RepID=UPI00102B0D03
MSVDPGSPLVLPPPVPPATAVDRIRWTLADGWTIVLRNLGHITIGVLIAQLVFPAIMIVMFGYVFGSAIAVPGGGNYREYLIPGLFAMAAFAGVIATASEVASDAGKGIVDRFRSLPMARSAVPFGQTGGDILLGALSIVFLAAAGLAVGWRAHHGIGATLAGFGLLLLLRYAVSWGGVLLGLMVSERTLNRLGALIFPVTMISNAFVPTDRMPTWLRVMTEWNPTSALVTACRRLFGNPGVPDGDAALPLRYPVAATIVWCVVMLAVFVPLAVRRYRTMER